MISHLWDWPSSKNLQTINAEEDVEKKKYWIKRIQIGKEEVKRCPSAEDMIFYVENYKESIKKENC